MFTKALFVALMLAFLPAPALAGGSNKSDKALEAALKIYANAVRWNDFEKARESVDPLLRPPGVFSDADEAYYKQFQVSGYLLKSAERPDPQTYSQRIELRIIDVASQTERTQTDRQTWRYDPVAKRWWLTSGLPKLD
ncbi:MAG: hypothetical protein RIQ43_375 [Pseudomonadota bacterium]|jgi:hypothetical protein